MHLIGRSKKATSDALSMTSVSLSRKSSFSSNASALAFSSPSPNQIGMISGVENQLKVNQQTNPFLSISDTVHNEKNSNHIDKFPQHSSTESRTKNIISGIYFIYCSYLLQIFVDLESSNEIKTNLSIIFTDFDKQSVNSDNANHDSTSKNLKNKVFF